MTVFSGGQRSTMRA